MGTSGEGAADDVASNKLQQRQIPDTGVHASQSHQEAIMPSIIPEKAPEDGYNWRKEEQILRSLGACPNVVQCFGGYSSTEVDGSLVYNLILEYAPGGSLRSLTEMRRADIDNSGTMDYGDFLAAIEHLNKLVKDLIQ
ncbi:hypothetical protein VitviT2T_014304 [Vitis vinifera]|nr:hypothetical protein VitviT2T_014304 [Vitis vinifera]